MLTHSFDEPRPRRSRPTRRALDVRPGGGLAAMGHAARRLRRAVERARRHAREGLPASFMEAVVACAGDAIVTTDEAQRIVVFNRAAEELFGHAASEVLGQPMDRLVPDAPIVAAEPPLAAPDDRPRASRRVVVRQEATGVRKDGSIFPAEVAISRLVLDGRRHLVTTVRDVSRSRHAEAALRDSEERFHQAFSSAAVGMAIFALDGRWMEANDALCRQLGYTLDELRALDYGAVTYAADLEDDVREGARLLSGELRSLVREKRWVSKSGAIVWVLVSASVVRDADGAPLYVLAQVQDITEQKAAEEELRRRSEELSRSNTELEQFAYVASHDLQEPLRMVASYTELLSQRYRGQLDERADKWIGYAADGARRLQALISDLLALSHVGSTGRPFALTNLDVVLDRALAPLGPALEESGGSVTRSWLPDVACDAVQLELVFRNLLSNALKFRRPMVPPRVHVRAEPAPDSASGWMISVRDNGIGLDMQFADRIFVIFQRLHTRDEYPGTGIGLAICRKIVERHGGRIWVESRPGEGTTVRFTLEGAVE